MLPSNFNAMDIPSENTATKTYRVKIATNGEDDRIVGYVDGLEAIKQSVYFILSTERYPYIIYTWNYGIELNDLIGQPMPYVMSEVERRVTDALTQDDRIISVGDFDFTVDHNKLSVTFNVVTNQGNLPTELEVVV